MVTIVRVKQIIDGLLAYVESDFNSAPEEQTFLYHMFYGIKDGRFDFYEQAKAIFLRRNTSPRKITTRMEYPKDKSHIPCVIIREPGRNSGEVDPMGGFGLAAPDEFGSDDYKREGFRESIHSNVEIMCFSDNMLESVLISEVIYALLVGARNTLEEEFSKFDFSANELIAENSLFPLPILIKTISLEVEYIERFPSIIRPEIVKSFIIDDAIVVGSDPNYEPPVDDRKYFEFVHPYVWMDRNGNGENSILSNTDWWLFGEGEELFKFQKSHLWLDEITNSGEIKVEAQVPWKLE